MNSAQVVAFPPLQSAAFVTAAFTADLGAFTACLGDFPAYFGAYTAFPDLRLPTLQILVFSYSSVSACLGVCAEDLGVVLAIFLLVIPVCSFRFSVGVLSTFAACWIFGFAVSSVAM